MALKGLIYNATEVRIRATVSVVAPSVAASFQQLAVSASIVRGVIGASEVRASAALQYVLPKAALSYVSIVLAVKLDPFNSNPYVIDYGIATDSSFLSVGKAFAELQATSEQRTIVFGKGISDAHQAIDVAALGFARPLADLGVLADTATREIGKTATPDFITQVDEPDLEVGKSFVEVAFQSEGPFYGQTYVDPTYLAENYVWDGGPIFDFSKVLTEFLDGTDDFQGLANIDDDQVMAFGKSLMNTAASSDDATKGVTTQRTDVALATDEAALSPAKSLIDAATHTDASIVDLGKAAQDVATTTESTFRAFDKALTEFPLTGDLSTFSLAKLSVDGAGATDAPQLSVSRGLSDSVGQADVALREAAKVLSDSAATSEAGNVRMTDYADITYFAQDYVGSQTNF
jgi:hypothetical protein